ncbi:hypothetical protein XENTR_v10005491 [Xenopus tropicalis]|uniref:Adenosine receptor A3 n=1 Tax=Xenopus tropicalis TaxID=8364 RepID=A0A8J0QJG3_XENTR|nr:adenosine receptor A3 [Xenopus tropicalis]KAE8623099.1 hypothetical protein XENTR_v10005491 [Xenopus tropicalis]|eukprot:XP_002932848.2 PREDICTED: adenosine receptor A3-like [Xenopus tropicalis]
MGNQTTESLTTIYIVTESLIGATAVLGNTLVIWAVRLNPALQDATFYFVVSLAIADFAVGVLVMPLAIILNMEIQMHFHVCLFVCCSIIILTNASILSLLAISIDRYLRIRIPIRYRSVVRKKRIFICILFSWILSALGALLPVFGWNHRSNLEENERDYLRCEFIKVMSLDFLVYFCFFGWVVIPLFLMVGLYTQIFYLIQKNRRHNISIHQGKQNYYSKEHRTASSLALVMFLFALCWLPISIVNCISYFYPSVAENSTFQPVVLLTILLSHANSAMNPIVYAFKIRKFKYTFLSIINKHILCKADVNESCSIDLTLENVIPK